MIKYETFEKDFKEALARFHDPEYRPPDALCEALGCGTEGGKAAVRSAITQGIARLKPPDATPKSAYASLIYELLWRRFQLRLTQEETAYQLNISRRTVNRLQHNAVDTLTASVWEQSIGLAGGARGTEEPSSPAPDWSVQFQRELDSLEAKAPSATANIPDVIDDVLEIINPMLHRQGISVKAMSIQPGLVVTVHPVLLHQVLLSAITHLALYMVEGEMALFAKLEDGNARITLTGDTLQEGLSPTRLAEDLPSSNKISVETLLDGRRAFIWITAPAVGRVTVLVVDDNDDMARLYRDCTIGTRYHIAHIAEGQKLPQAVSSLMPAAIVLDIMLPDVDGWRLLMRLHENPATRQIPVIVCTVIREEDLAISLGAACYLPKPVRPLEFIQVLDRICPPAAEESSTAPANSAGAVSGTAHLL